MRFAANLAACSFMLVYGFTAFEVTSASLSSDATLELIRRYQPNFTFSNNPTHDLEELVRYAVSLRSNSMHQVTPDVKNNATCTSHEILRPLCQVGGECTPVDTLVRALGETNPTLAHSFAKLCPVLLFQSHLCDFSSSHSNSSTADSRSRVRSSPKLKPSDVPWRAAKPEPFQVWLYGILSVTVISACSLTGLAIVPLLTRQLFDVMMNIFQGLAVGSLCGSAIFHLIPQAFDLVEKNDYLWKSMVVFSGIYFFYISERIMKILADRKKEEKKKIHLNALAEEAGGLVDHHGHSHGPPKDGSIASVAWLIIFGDGMHNFIDGLSLGAAFNNSVLGGISISVAVICEEFPHELGDFAVLLGAGMSAKQAVLYNFLSALTCFLGLGVGILVGDLTEGTPAIFAFAGGMFLYISLVGMMGEINDSLEKVNGCLAQVKTLLLQNLGIIVGVITMFVMAKYADNIDFESFSFDDADKAVYSASLENINRNAKSMVGHGF